MMTTDDKERWLIRQGILNTYSMIEGEGPYMRWESRRSVPMTGFNRAVKVRGEGDEAIYRLYAAVKNRLFKLCQDLQNDTI